MNHLIPSEGKSCSKCGREGLSLMHPNYPCDYCFFGAFKRFPAKTESVWSNVTDLAGGIFGLVILAFIGYWIFSAVSDGSRYNGSEECGEGYHLEGYATAYGETITECFEN